MHSYDWKLKTYEKQKFHGLIVQNFSIGKMQTAAGLARRRRGNFFEHETTPPENLQSAERQCVSDVVCLFS
jgi:hypothetical protein